MLDLVFLLLTAFFFAISARMFLGAGDRGGRQ